MTNSDLESRKAWLKKTYPQADVVDTLSNKKTDSIIDDRETCPIEWEGYLGYLIEPNGAGTSYSRILLPFPKGDVLPHVPDSEVIHNA